MIGDEGVKRDHSGCFFAEKPFLCNLNKNFLLFVEYCLEMQSPQLSSEVWLKSRMLLLPKNGYVNIILFKGLWIWYAHFVILKYDTYYKVNQEKMERERDFNFKKLQSTVPFLLRKFNVYCTYTLLLLQPFIKRSSNSLENTFMNFWTWFHLWKDKNAHH